MQRPSVSNRGEAAFQGLSLFRDMAEFGSCKKIEKGCKYFHKGIDCIQQFRSHDCSGGCRYEHRKIINDDHKHLSKSAPNDGRGSLKRKSDHDGDSRHDRSRDDRDMRDPRDDRDMRDSRDKAEQFLARELTIHSERSKEKERDRDRDREREREREGSPG